MNIQSIHNCPMYGRVGGNACVPLGRRLPSGSSAGLNVLHGVASLTTSKKVYD